MSIVIKGIEIGFSPRHEWGLRFTREDEEMQPCEWVLWFGPLKIRKLKGGGK